MSRTQVYGVAFSTRGALASCSQDQTLRLFAGTDASALRPTFAARHAAWVYAVAFAPSGEAVATAAADYVVRVFAVDAAGGAILVADLRRHEGIVYAVSFAPDAAGALLASGSVDGTAVFWRKPRPRGAEAPGGGGGGDP